MIWFDIEDRKEWGSCDHNINYLHSLVKTAEQMGVKVGIYASSSQWSSIVRPSRPADFSRCVEELVSNICHCGMHIMITTLRSVTLNLLEDGRNQVLSNTEAMLVFVEPQSMPISTNLSKLNNIFILSSYRTFIRTTPSKTSSNNYAK
jgi:hypothetical protein